MKNCFIPLSILLLFAMPFLLFSQPGSATWIGGTSTDWNDAANWDNGVPGINTDVQILSGSTYYPLLTGHLGIDTTSAEIPYTCAYIIISNGASLTIDADDADLIVKGQIEVVGEINVADDIHLCNGSQLDIYNNAVIKCGLRDGEYGKTNLYTGSTVNQHDGELFTEELLLENGCQYNGVGGILYLFAHGSVPDTQNIIIKDPDSYFFGIQIGGAFSGESVNAALTECDYPLTIPQVPFSYGLIVYNNATLNIENDTLNIMSLRIEFGTVNMISGHITISNSGVSLLTGGKLNMDGGEIIAQEFWCHAPDAIANISGGTINLSRDFTCRCNKFNVTGGTVRFFSPFLSQITYASRFHNIIIDKPYDWGIVKLLDTIFIENDLIINSGPLLTSNHPIFIKGNWTNNVGDAGFIEGTSTVTFDGNTRADITTDETFYKLIMNKTATGYHALEFMDGVTINVLDDFRILDGGVEMNMNSTLIVGDTLYIEAGAGLNAYGETGLTIEVGGDWINNNTYYNTGGVGFAPGISTVRFNGTQNASIHYAGNVESFYHLILDKPGDTLFISDSLLVSGDLLIQNGLLKSAIGSHVTSKSNITIETTGVWEAYRLLLNGSVDQTLMTNNTSSYFGQVTIDKPTTAYIPGDLNILYFDDLIIKQGTVVCDNIDLYLSANLIINNGLFTIDPGGHVILLGKIRVNDSGILELQGLPANNIFVHAPVGLTFDGVVVNDGGTIKAVHTEFTAMTDSALYIREGGIIDPAMALTGCRFRENESGGTLMTINNDQMLTLDNIDFGPNPGGGAYNAAKTINQGKITFSNVSGTFAGPAYEDDTYDRIDWSDQGTWLGTVSDDWFSSPNWLFGVIPDGNTDVVIPGGCTYYPVITVMDTECHNLEIQTGGQITISQRFNVNGNAVIHGHVILDIPTTSQWYILGDISWEAGSQCTDATTSYMIVRGDWTFQAGSNVTLDDGIVWLHSFDSQKVISHESDSYFNYLRVLTIDTLDFCSTSTDSLGIGTMVIESGSLVTVHSTHPILFNGNLVSFGGHFQANAGEVVFQGLGGSIDLASGDYLNNVTCNTTFLPVYQYNAYSDTLVIKGNLVIGTENPSGVGFDPQNNVTVVYGNWINHIGTSGFIPGTGTVIIKGSGISDFYGQTTFYNLHEKKTSQFTRVWNQINISNEWKIEGVFIVFGTVISEFLDFDDYNALLIVNGGVVETEYFDQGGTLQVNNGDFIAYSIEEQMGLEGAYYLNGGSIWVNQDQANYLDISGIITIVNGYFTLGGGHDDSWWPMVGKTCTLTITGGVFDMGEKGIHLRTGLTADVSGGRIRTERNLFCEVAMTTFRPSGGVFEFAGGHVSSTARLSSGNWLHDVWINKTGGLSVNALSNLLIKNEFNIIKGKFSTNGYLIQVGD